MSTKRSSGASREEVAAFLVIYFVIPLWFFFIGYSYLNVPEKQEKEISITEIKIDKDDSEPYTYSGILNKGGRIIEFTSKDLIQNPLEPQKVILSRKQLAFTENILLFMLNVLTSFGLPIFAFCTSMEVYEDNILPKLISAIEIIIVLVFFIFLLV